MERKLALALAAAAAAGCGPGLAAQDPHEITRHDLLSAAGDPGALQQMIRGEIVDGGLWFADPRCTEAFPVAADLHAGQFAAFARCLAGLHLQPSPRRDPFPDVAVLTYPPGIEIEARILDEPDGPHLTWVGYAARRDLADALPTISPAALEALRIAGDPHGDLDPDQLAKLQHTPTAGPVSAAWLKLCLDTSGKVTSVHPRQATSLEAARVFTAAVGTWRFRPFIAGGHPLPACSMVELVYPPAKAPAHETLPMPSISGDELVIDPVELKSYRRSGTILVQPDDKTKLAMQAAHASRLIGAFRLCLDDHGRVASIRTLRSTGFPAYDGELHAAMQQWVYAPYLDDGHAVPVCTDERFIYHQR